MLTKLLWILSKFHLEHQVSSRQQVQRGQICLANVKFTRHIFNRNFICLILFIEPCPAVGHCCHALIHYSRQPDLWARRREHATLQSLPPAATLTNAEVAPVKRNFIMHREYLVELLLVAWVNELITSIGINQVHVPSGTTKEKFMTTKFIPDNHCSVDKVTATLRETGLQSSNLISWYWNTKSNDKQWIVRWYVRFCFHRLMAWWLRMQ